MKKEKLKYEKPEAMDISSVAPVYGDSCDSGNAATECPAGNDPETEAFCPGGNIATGNCEMSGSDAGKTCYSNGGTAGWGCMQDSS